MRLRFPTKLSFVPFFLVVWLSGCTSIPDGVTPVNGFELNRYLGTWYEIARLDHSFERDLNQVTANYSLNDDGTVKVLNRGFNAGDEKWEEAEGKAEFVGDADTGHLKVSFFGPFYASYVIAELDEKNYQYALVTGPDRDYLWILARSPDISSEIVQRLVKRAKTLGFPVDDLIYVAHD